MKNAHLNDEFCPLDWLEAFPVSWASNSGSWCGAKDDGLPKHFPLLIDEIEKDMEDVKWWTESGDLDKRMQIIKHWGLRNSSRKTRMQENNSFFILL